MLMFEYSPADLYNALINISKSSTHFVSTTFIYNEMF